MGSFSTHNIFDATFAIPIPREGWECEEPHQVKGASPSRRFCLANSLDLSRPDMPGEKLALFEISLRPLCISSSCRRSLLQRHSSRNCRGSLHAWWEGKSAVGLPTSPLLHPCWSSACRNDPAALPGVKPPNLAQQWGFLASWGMLCRCWEDGGAGEHLLQLRDHQSSTSESPQGEYPEVCEALLIREPQIQACGSRNGFGNPG